jgi:hypothetical protein
MRWQAGFMMQPMTYLVTNATHHPARVIRRIGWTARGSPESNSPLQWTQQQSETIARALQRICQKQVELSVENVDAW